MTAETAEEVVRRIGFHTREIDPTPAKYFNFARITGDPTFQRVLDIAESNKTYQTIQAACEAIKKNIELMEKDDKPRLVDNYVFAAGFPQSYDLINPYYDMFLSACLDDKLFTGYTKKGTYGPFYNNRELLTKRIEELKATTVLIFIPLICNKKYDVIQKETGFSIEFYRKMIETYNKLRKTNIPLNPEVLLANNIYNDLKSGKSIEEICTEKSYSPEYVQRVIKDHLNSKQLKEVNQLLENIKAGREMHRSDVIKTLLNYVPSGIQLDEKHKMPFSVIDYCSLTKIELNDLLEFIVNGREMRKIGPVNDIALAKVKTFIKNAMESKGTVITYEQSRQDKECIIINDNKFILGEYAKAIFDYFKENNITPYYRVVYQAFLRIARNQPVLPLRNEAPGVVAKLRKQREPMEAQTKKKTI